MMVECFKWTYFKYTIFFHGGIRLCMKKEKNIIISGKIYSGAPSYQHHGIFLTQSLKTDAPKKRTEITFDDLQSNLKDISTCYLCGSSDYSMMDYYRKFDTVGLISLNDWYILDFQLKAYDENGNENQEV